MQFRCVQPIAAPREFVFERAGEFDRLAQALTARGAAVVPPAAQSNRPRYEIEYPFRKEMWPVALELRDRVPPETMEIVLEAKVLTGLALFDFRAPGPDRTQAELTVTLTPRGMQGRLLIASLHLVRARLQERLDEEFAALARAAERLWRNGGAR